MALGVSVAEAVFEGSGEAVLVGVSSVVGLDGCADCGLQPANTIKIVRIMGIRIMVFIRAFIIHLRPSAYIPPRALVVIVRNRNMPPENNVNTMPAASIIQPASLLRDLSNTTIPAATRTRPVNKMANKRIVINIFTVLSYFLI